MTLVTVHVNVWLVPAAIVTGNVDGDVRTKLRALPASPSPVVIPAKAMVEIPCPLFFIVMDKGAVVATVEAGKVSDVVPIPLVGALPLYEAAVMMS